MQSLTLTLSDCAVELSVWKRSSYVTSADFQCVSLYVCDVFLVVLCLMCESRFVCARLCLSVCGHTHTHTHTHTPTHTHTHPHTHTAGGQWATGVKQDFKTHSEPFLPLFDFWTFAVTAGKRQQLWKWPLVCFTQSVANIMSASLCEWVRHKWPAPFETCPSVLLRQPARDLYVLYVVIQWRRTAADITDHRAGVTDNCISDRQQQCIGYGGKSY